MLNLSQIDSVVPEKKLKLFKSLQSMKDVRLTTDKNTDCNSDSCNQKMAYVNKEKDVK